MYTHKQFYSVYPSFLSNGQNHSGQLTTNFTHTHTDFVCLDTIFLRNTIDINYGRRPFPKAYNLLRSFSTIIDAKVRNNQNHAETSDFIILTYTLHITVLLGSKQTSAISYHLLEPFGNKTTHHSKTLQRNVVPGTNKYCSVFGGRSLHMRTRCTGSLCLLAHERAQRQGMLALSISAMTITFQLHLLYFMCVPPQNCFVY